MARSCLGTIPHRVASSSHEDLHLREREGQEAQDPRQPTPGRERVGGGLRDAQIMDTAAVGVAQKEDEEQGIDEQDVFDGVVFFLAAITCGLCNRVLGGTMRRSVPSWAKGGTLARWRGKRLLLSGCDDGRRVGLRDAKALRQGR